MKRRICLAWFGDLDTPPRSRSSAGHFGQQEPASIPAESRTARQGVKELAEAKPDRGQRKR